MNVNLLKKKDFSLLMLGKLVSLIGSQMQNFALSLYVLKITGSATKFASVLAITLIPQLILGPLAGVFADWLDRKKIIVYLDMLSGITIGIFAVIYKFNGGLDLIHIYILAIIMAMISLLFQPAIGTVIPSIVKKEELVDANGINSFIMNIGNFLAPMIAGIFFGLYGLFLILIINSVSFIMSSISEMFIKIPKTNKKPDNINLQSFVKDLSDGFKFIKNKKIMLNIVILALVINFIFNPVFSIGLTYISKEILKVSDSQYGILESILVISMVVAPFIATKVCKKFKLGRILFFDIFISSIFIGIMSIIPSAFYLSLFKTNIVPYISIVVVGFIIGLITAIANISLGIMFQQEVPLNMMGRVGTVMNTGCMAAVPLGQMVFGLLLDSIATWLCLLLAATVLFITIMLFRKNLYKDTQEDPELLPDANDLSTI